MLPFICFPLLPHFPCISPCTLRCWRIGQRSTLKPLLRCITSSSWANWDIVSWRHVWCLEFTWCRLHYLPSAYVRRTVPAVQYMDFHAQRPANLCAHTVVDAVSGFWFPASACTASKLKSHLMARIWISARACKGTLTDSVDSSAFCSWVVSSAITFLKTVKRYFFQSYSFTLTSLMNLSESLYCFWFHVCEVEETVWGVLLIF